jgi:hypothetical protein
VLPLNSNRPGHDFSFITFIAVVPMGRNVERNFTGFFGTLILRTQASAVLGSLSPSALTAWVAARRQSTVVGQRVPAVRPAENGWQLKGLLHSLQHWQVVHNILFAFSFFKLSIPRVFERVFKSTMHGHRATTTSTGVALCELL